MIIAAMKQALECLDDDNDAFTSAQILRAAIEQAEEAEPAYMLRELEEENGGVFVKPYNPTGINLGIPLFTLPAPVPAGWLECIPYERGCDHLDEFNEVGQAYADGWNACRKAMLAVSPKPGG